MDIIVNGESIDYSLENETTLGEVMASLRAWLEESGMLVASLSLDGEAMFLGDKSWRNSPVDSTGVLAVKAVNLREGRIRQLETVRGYFLLLEGALSAPEGEAFRELSDAYPDVRRMLPHLLDDGPQSAILIQLDETLSRAGFPLSSDEPSVNSDGIAQAAAHTINLIDIRLREAATPETVAASAAGELAAMAESLDDVAVHLQTGKDKAAMETIVRLAEKLQILMRTLSWMPESLSSTIGNMTGMLSELEEALKLNDTVLIGDLLEYEIKPRLLELPSILSHFGEIAP